MSAYQEIFAGGEARQHNGNNYNNQTNYYPLRQKRSDDKLKEQARNKALLQAAAEGQTVRVNKLLRDGADVDFVDKYDWTALHHAAYSGFEDTARDLLAAGADVNARSEHFGTPLTLAALKGRLHVSATLLASRASVHAPAGEMGSVILAACAGGNVELINALLERGADMDRIEEFDKQFIDYLLAPHDVGNYVLFGWNFDGYLERLLEERSAEARSPGPCWEERHIYLDTGREIWCPDKECTTAVNITALYDNQDALMSLLEKDHSPERLVRRRGDAIIYTSAFGDVSCLVRLLNWSKTHPMLIKANSSILENYTSAAATAAAFGGNNQCLLYLLPDHGFENVPGAPSPHPKVSDGMTALLWAAKKGYSQCVETLTNYHEPDKDWPNFVSHGSTPIMDAASNGHLECVRILITKGASLKSPTMDGEPGFNALHCAAEYGHVVIIEELVKAGIDINSQDEHGDSPLMRCLYRTEWGEGEIFDPRLWAIRKLIELGADPEIKDNYGNSVADLMRKYGREDALAWLEKK